MEFTWVRLPIQLIGKITPNSLILLSWLLNHDTGGHELIVRKRELASLLNCTVRRVDGLFRELEQAGLILSRERLRTGTRLVLQPDILPPRRKHGNVQAAPDAEQRPKYAPERPVKPQSKPKSRPKEYSSITPDMLDLFFK